MLAPHGGDGISAGSILGPDNVAAENVAAVCIPNVRMKARANHDVVLDKAAETFAVFDATAKAEIVCDDVKRGAVV
jgi:hypothetical protein